MFSLLHIRSKSVQRLQSALKNIVIENMFYVQEERKRKLEVEMDFPAEDLALATIPGINFNPRVGFYIYCFI